MRDYFYGPRGDLSPHVLRLKFDEVSVYRVGGGPRAPTSALPIGASAHACRLSGSSLFLDNGGASWPNI